MGLYAYHGAGTSRSASHLAKVEVKSRVKSEFGGDGDGNGKMNAKSKSRLPSLFFGRSIFRSLPVSVTTASIFFFGCSQDTISIYYILWLVTWVSIYFYGFVRYIYNVMHGPSVSLLDWTPDPRHVVTHLLHTSFPLLPAPSPRLVLAIS